MFIGSVGKRKIVFALLKKLVTKSVTISDTGSVPILLNQIFIEVYDIETRLIKKLKLPFGLSLICVAKK